MKPPAVKTVREHLAGAYANLGRAHAALQDGVTEYRRIHHIIGNKLYHGLLSGTMSMHSLFDDERLKMTLPQACCYCGSRENLTLDHLIPRIKGGPDEADNLVWACRTCNSSKQGRDLLEWMQSRSAFPSILLLRRYLKIVTRYCQQQGCLDMYLSELGDVNLPFDLRRLPDRFPPLGELKQWVFPDEQG